MAGGVGADPGGSRRQFGEGPLSRATALVYNLLVVELLFLLTAVPTLLPVLLLDRDPSNLPLVAAGALPLGPALAAALYALRHRGRDATDLRPASAFWRGYRLNAFPVLRLWLPFLVFLTIAGINFGYFAAANVPDWWAPLLAGVVAVVTLWMANALVITALFTFRAVDVARLARHFLGRTPGVTIGNACLLIVVAGGTVLTSEAVLALVASPLLLAFLGVARPMIGQIREDFTG